MSNHNTPYSKGAIMGMLTDMVGCIKELLLEGKNVKIADLAIFLLKRASAKTNSGGDNEKDNTSPNPSEGGQTNAGESKEGPVNP